MANVLPTFFGAIGRLALSPAAWSRRTLCHVSGVSSLLAQAVWFATWGAFSGRCKLRPVLSPLLRSVGVKSFPIVALVNLLIGAILVLQTGDVMREYGQIHRIPGGVAVSMTRELGPLMVAVVMTARVGASYTAVLAAMKLNEEVMALETMAIHPVGYLVAPRVLSMLIMMPCLTMLAYLIGMIGGAVVANGVYDISYGTYVASTFEALDLADLGSGLLKAVVFSVLIAIVSCYFGLIAEGGPMGLGRYIMVAVVTSLVVVILADAMLTAFSVNYLFS